MKLKNKLLGLGVAASLIIGTLLYKDYKNQYYEGDIKDITNIVENCELAINTRNTEGMYEYCNWMTVPFLGTNFDKQAYTGGFTEKVNGRYKLRKDIEDKLDNLVKVDLEAGIRSIESDKIEAVVHIKSKKRFPTDKYGFIEDKFKSRKPSFDDCTIHGQVMFIPFKKIRGNWKQDRHDSISSGYIGECSDFEKIMVGFEETFYKVKGELVRKKQREKRISYLEKREDSVYDFLDKYFNDLANNNKEEIFKSIKMRCRNNMQDPIKKLFIGEMIYSYNETFYKVHKNLKHKTKIDFNIDKEDIDAIVYFEDDKAAFILVEEKDGWKFDHMVYNEKHFPFCADFVEE